MTFNHGVEGSSPSALTINDNIRLKTSVLHGVLQKIIITPLKSGLAQNPFDCAARGRLSFMCWALGLFAMLEAFTAVFGIISAGIFLAHAVDGYWSR